MRRFELPAYLLLVVVLLFLLVTEGRANTQLQQDLPIAPKELYKKLASSQVKLQIVDARPAGDDGYEDTHIPGALPFPGCDLSTTPAAAKDRIYPWVPTIVVTADGNPDMFRKCLAEFAHARNLEGGMEAWSDASLPEDSGEYTAPRASAGGGCL